MLEFMPFSPDSPQKSDKVIKAGDVPKEFDIFKRDESTFLPEGKTFADLTPEEEEVLRQRYRFDFYRPGIYGSLSGFGKMINDF
jgi:hypothetical protein